MPWEHAAAALLGRGAECRVLADLLAEVSRTVVVLIHGEPGIGKTSLLAWVKELASSRGMVVVSAAGTPTETGLPFAALHQLLRPLLGGPDPAPHRRRAVLTAMGAHDGASAAVFETATAVLELFAEVSTRSGLLVAVDDVQWLDRPTRDVLTFVGRRLGDEQVRMAFAGRDDFASTLEHAALGPGWRVLALERLGDSAASALLDRVAPDLSPDVRRRILDEATGNPLALVELPKTVGDVPSDDDPEPTPVSQQLASAFASRLTLLPERTRRLVLLAALHDSDLLGELIAAARALTGTDISLRDLEPAVEVGLLDVDRDRVRFGHPLARSAVFQHAGPAARQEVHRVLARASRSVDHRAWHAAAAADAPDESMAREFDLAATRAVERGALQTAARAYEEAARLSADPARRATRQLLELELLDELGQHERATALLREVDSAALDTGERTRLDWMREVLDAGVWSGGDRVLRLTSIARRMHAAGETRRAAEVLTGIALRCWWSNLEPQTRVLVAEAADELARSRDDPLHVVVTALGAPVERGAEALEAYGRIDTATLSPDAAGFVMLALGATAVGDQPRGALLFSTAIAEARQQGRTTSLSQALAGAAWAEVHLGRLRRAEVTGDEGRRLARDLGQPLWESTASLALAAAHGLRGDVDSANQQADSAEQVFLGVGANPMLAQVCAARGFTALAGGQYDEAFAHLYGVFDRRHVAYHEHFRTFLVAELAEAAAGAHGQLELARALVEELIPRSVTTRSPILNAGLLVARPMLAEDHRKEAYFEDALQDGLAAWPMHRARVHLQYGAWLRRSRRIAEARVPLRHAHETFAGLGATPWAERAAIELRATGEGPVERPSAAWEHLTPQELQIAALAAAGLTNRQIGERLFLSHRTISSHLYHLFPKLGISSRSQLGVALSGLQAPDQPGSSETLT